MREDKMNKQSSLFDIDDNQQVECLGKIFDSEDQRREYFRNELRKKLPELRKIEGFPKGNDEDIIALSDPPYYTACPNPWLDTFLRTTDHQEKPLDIEPFVYDVAEGKNDKIYLAHSYHTKVPYKAIMKYILHYTRPGDVVLDAFAGTGMTALAAYECGDPVKVMQLDSSAEIGERRAIISDLSPAATFISNNFTKNFSNQHFLDYAYRYITNLEKNYGKLFSTFESNGDHGMANYYIWSEIFSCPNCQCEFDYYSVAYKNGKTLKEYVCPNCGVILNKKKSQKVWTRVYDSILQEYREVAKLKPVVVNYTYNGQRFERKVNSKELDYYEQILDRLSNYKVMVEKLPNGVNTSQPQKEQGFCYVHDFFSARNNIVISEYIRRINSCPEKYKNMLLFLLTSSMQNSSFLYRWRMNGKGGILSGTLYICSTPQENNIFNILKRKLKDISNINAKNRFAYVSTNSATQLNIESNNIDYIFTDPPFGANLNYSELNFFWETILKVRTNNKDEAIVNKVQNKSLNDYGNLMTQSFSECYRVLKPGGWITIEFSNSQASVWNSIQESIQKSGFIIANVSGLNKKQGSFKAVTSTTAVKQDLVISAYKPLNEDLKQINTHFESAESVWMFLNQHLQKLPIFESIDGETVTIIERTPRILFDRMVSFYVQNGQKVPISSSEFQNNILTKYPIRDGMIFLDSQVPEYDRKRAKSNSVMQQPLFVSDESSAIEWIRQQLMKKPQTRQDLQPEFMKEIQHIAKYEALPELDELLSENFLQYKGENKVPDQIVSYFHKNYHDLRGLDNTNEAIKEKAMNRWYVPDPNKQVDLDKLRERGLLREFNKYVEEIDGTRKKLKNFRMEAIRAGFKKAWLDKEYQKIVDVVKHLPSKVVEEDDKLLMYYDNASIKVES